MIGFASSSLLAGALEPAIAAYALRLSRTFGIRRVGWSLFTAFFVLALLHLVESVAPGGATSGATGLVGPFIVLLLLVGMAHTEAFLAERVRTERKQRALSGELEERAAENAELRTAYHSLLAQSAQRAQIQGLLEESERQYRAIFTDHPQPMWIFDLRSFRILAVNNAALRALGFTRQQFVTMTAKDIQPPEDVPAFVSESARPALSAGPRQRCRFYKQDRTLAQVETVSSDLEFDQSPARLVVVHDLSDYQLLDQQLRQIERVEATGRLARGIAHHFNNLITPVLGYTTILLEKLHERETAKQLQQIATAAHEVAGLTRQLLALGRGNPTGSTLLDLTDLMGGLDQTICKLLGPSIILRKAYAPYLPPVRGDATVIQQVLINLVLNARDAVGGRGSLQITTASVDVTSDHVLRNPEARLGQFVCLTVRDTGCGMTPVVREHLFEPFFTTKEVGKGTGLGLATVYHAVKQHNGWVEVTTQPELGTEFRLFFPSAATA